MRLWASSSSSTSTSRSKTLKDLLEWAESVEIKLGGISISESQDAGLGISSQQDLASNSLVLTVPSAVALSIESPGEGPDDRSVLQLPQVDRKLLETLPWYVQFAVYLNKLDHVSSVKSSKVDMKPWLAALPRAFDTPIHWTKEQQSQLQYDFLQDSIPRQEQQWKQYYDKLDASKWMTWDQFVWGCECARSRAFSGAYTGGAFNPFSYAFTLLLVLVYVGAGLGTLEQAANGAGLVFCAQVLKDFVLPKLFKKKRYVICPVMDMANHKSLAASAEVSFEFFGDAYSLAISNGITVGNDKQVYISYGTRSNDQLLQYYGFVESNNPHDVYILPPLRDWNIAKLEEACGITFAPGRLQKLERAGLLGTTREQMMSTSTDDDQAANSAGGVVVTRAAGVDPAVMQALRALVSTDEEWDNAGGAIGNFVESVGPENECLARLAAKTALELELADKPTTLEQDEELLQKMNQAKSMMDASTEDRLAVLFRIEKKKLLQDTIRKLG
ncbi:expressed unknown protein [Seminavis robusta]|uniref:Rubisco LSMT substrate-binding domain-containing protein n=1 Tax=Seminavis robusta TaxID=568900 RepID=A0A9N8HPF0_9STRA|nr:expressed unknown protein [Seminavis robusta]|eukprot:Sro1082_g239190.1 n/a (501) ;mRNA; f:14644-16233